MRRFALLLGCAGGTDSDKLAYAHSDVLRMYNLLDRPGWDVDNDVLVPSTLDKPQDVGVFIQDLQARAGPNDLIFVYYAGHAVHQPRRRRGDESLYLVLGQSSVRQNTNLLPVSGLIDLCFGEGAPAHSILALDCCYAGEARPRMLRSILDDLGGRLKPIVAMGGHSRTLFASCAEDQAAYEGVRRTTSSKGKSSEVAGGYFTTVLLEAFQGRVPTEVAPTDGLLGMDRVAEWVKSQFQQKAGSAGHSRATLQQVPEVVHTGSLVVTCLSGAHVDASSDMPTFLPTLEQVARRLEFRVELPWTTIDTNRCPVSRAAVTRDPLVVALDRGQCGIEVNRREDAPMRLLMDTHGQGFCLSPDGSLLAIETRHTSPFTSLGGIGVYTSDTLTQRAWLPARASLLTFTNDSQHIVAADPDTGGLRLWQWRNQTQRLWNGDVCHRGRINHLVLAAQPSLAAVTGGSDGRVLLWSLEGRESEPFNATELPSTGGGQVTALASSPISGWIAAGFGSGAVQLWNIVTNLSLEIVTLPRGSLVSVLAFADNEQRLAIGRSDGSVWALNLQGVDIPKSLTAPSERLDSTISSLAFAPSTDRWTMPLLGVGAQSGVVSVVSGADPSVVLAARHNPRRVIKLMWIAQSHKKAHLLVIDEQSACEYGLFWTEHVR